MPCKQKTITAVHCGVQLWTHQIQDITCRVEARLLEYSSCRSVSTPSSALQRMLILSRDRATKDGIWISNWIY